MKDFNVGEKIQILIDDTIFNAVVSDKSVRETRCEITTNYWLDVSENGWSISLSKVLKKGAEKMSKQDGILDLVVKGEWFDKIKSGEKTHEFRERNRYWDQRLGIDVYCHEVKDSTDPLERASARQSMRYKAVRFRRGYAKDAERMLFSIKSIGIVNGLHTDLHTDDVVFDIELGVRLA